MGCCQSRSQETGSHSAQNVGAHGGTSTPSVLQQSTSSLPSHHGPLSSREPASSTRSRRRSRSGQVDTPLGEHFNKPLVVHEWTGKHKYTRSLPGPNNKREVWRRRSLEHEREVFFETQTTGASQVWYTLKMVSELARQRELETAQGILDAAEITVPYGDLAYGVFDPSGQFYQMPEWVVADPTQVLEADAEEQTTDRKDGMDSEDSEERRESKGKGVLRPADSFVVKARLSDRGGPAADITVRLGNEENVRTLARRIKGEAGLEQNQTVRIAYLGKLLKETQRLRDHGYNEDHMINALVAG